MVSVLVATLATGLLLGATPASATLQVVVVPWFNVVFVPVGADLAQALVPGNAGRLILLARGEHTITGPLTVPSGAWLDGAGVMRFGSDGIPSGLGSAARITATHAFPGNLLRLEDGATLRGLRVDDLFPARGGNTVAVLSTGVGSEVDATLLHVELRGAGPSAAAPAGPVGRVLLALTLTGHYGAEVGVDVDGSILEAAGTSSAIFAVHFATAADMSVVLRRNRIGGQLDANAGVPSPTAVVGSRLTIDSARNLFQRDGDPNMAWYLHGGSDAPVSNGWPGAVGCTFLVTSRHDRIVGFKTGILGITGERFRAQTATPTSGNTLVLDLDDIEIETPAEGADYKLFGTITSGPIAGGDGNVLRFDLRRSQGSGPRAENFVANTFGPDGSTPGDGNRVVNAGSARRFERSNDGFEGGTDLGPFFEQGAPRECKGGGRLRGRERPGRRSRAYQKRAALVGDVDEPTREANGPRAGCALRPLAHSRQPYGSVQPGAWLPAQSHTRLVGLKRRFPGHENVPTKNSFKHWVN